RIIPRLSHGGIPAARPLGDRIAVLVTLRVILAESRVGFVA
ncbi:MAG: hypothetical protein RJA70_1709, partial [Pseudomonadota bacterium]